MDVWGLRLGSGSESQFKASPACSTAGTPIENRPGECVSGSEGLRLGFRV